MPEPTPETPTLKLTRWTVQSGSNARSRGAVIIDAGDMGDALEERAPRQVTTEALWQRQPLAASRAGRVHAVTSDAFVVPGPRVVEAAETMALWLHGVSP